MHSHCINYMARLDLLGLKLLQKMCVNSIIPDTVSSFQVCAALVSFLLVCGYLM